MKSPSIFHDDVFYEFFRPFRHPDSGFDIWGGHGLETFGSDLLLVNKSPKEFVWTVLDGASGQDQWITPGIRWVNRVCYLLTEVPHNWADVEFCVHHNLKSLTQIGLKRRLSALREIVLRQNAFCLASKKDWLYSPHLQWRNWTTISWLRTRRLERINFLKATLRNLSATQYPS